MRSFQLNFTTLERKKKKLKDAVKKQELKTYIKKRREGFIERLIEIKMVELKELEEVRKTNGKSHWY